MPLKNWIIAGLLVVGLFVMVMLARGQELTKVQQQEQILQQLINQYNAQMALVQDALRQLVNKQNVADQIMSQIQKEKTTLDQMKAPQKGTPAPAPKPEPKK